MSAFRTLLALPPPPTPRPGQETSAWQVLVVIVLVLGAVALVANTLRSFTARKEMQSDGSGPALPPILQEPDSYPPPRENSIIPFPVPNRQDAEPTGRAEEKPEMFASNVIAHRLRRLTGVPIMERRRLGDRQPKPSSEPSRQDPSTETGTFMLPALRHLYPLDDRGARPLGNNAGARPVEESRPAKHNETAESTRDDVIAEPQANGEDDAARTAFLAEHPDFVGFTEPRPWPTGAVSMPRSPGPDNDDVWQATADSIESKESVRRFWPPSLIDEGEAQAVVTMVESTARQTDMDVASESLAGSDKSPSELVDEGTQASIISTVRELLFCANVGELLHGFSLYSDEFLFKTMDESGLDEAEFERLYGSVLQRPIESWTRLASVSSFTRCKDGSVAALVRYLDAPDGTSTPAERYTFVVGPRSELWLIAGISPVYEQVD